MKNKLFGTIFLFIFSILNTSCSSILTNRTPSQENLAASNSNKSLIEGRNYPSIFQAWQSITPTSSPDKIADLAKHDLIWQSWSAWGLKCADSTFLGLCTQFTKQSISNLLDLRSKLKKLNPHAIILAEVRYHDAINTYIPEDSQWWLRDSSNNKIPKTNGTSVTNYFLLDYKNSTLQDTIANLCLALVNTGGFDGCMFDWWNHETPAHVSLIQKVRNKVGITPLLIVNTNGNLPLLSSAYINGMYMEGFGQKFFNNWKVARDNFEWAESNLQKPVITAFDTWGDINSDTNDSRMSLALSLIFSDGYYLFGDKLHNHVWHQLWNVKLGVRTSTTYNKNLNNSYSREFQNGSVYFNPPENNDIEIKFDEQRTRATNNETSTHFILKSGDGDFFLKTNQNLTPIKN